MQHRRVVILLVGVALLLALVAFDPAYAAVARVVAWAGPIIRDHEVLGVLLFVLLSAMSGVLFFFSTQPIVPLAVYAWGKPTTIPLLWGSWLLGAMVSYAIGRRPGRRLVRWLVPRQSAALYEEKIAARLSFPLVLLFQVAVPSEIPGLALGALRYRFRSFLAARAIAELPFAVGAVYLGDSFVRRQYVPLVAIAVGGVALTAGALYLLHKRMER
jgi:uncharacterized membrane protein YdjX (TVP38/TMEM64 family)